MTVLNNYRVITALITPFTDQGQIDFASLAKLVRWQQEAGNAILLLGSTGEGLALSLPAKKAVVEYVFSLNPQIPVIIGVGGFQLEEQLSWIEYCQDHYPVAGFLLVTPLYAKPGIKGQIAWFRALLDAAKLPCILYNIPGRAAVKLHKEVLTDLVSHPNFAGLKEASGELDIFSEYRAIIPKHLLYSGNDELLAAQMQRGGFGVISVAANVWPLQTKAYLDLCLAKKNTTEVDRLWTDAANSLFMASNPIPLKVLLHCEGVLHSARLLPPLTHEELSEMDITKLVVLSQQVQSHKDLQP